VPAAYLHSDLDAFERVEIIHKLRKGEIRAIVGVNLLREGLDLPEVSLVAILEADKEGFLRSETSLIQIAGRAARNVHGEVILYADRITDSMRRFMQEAERRRQKQLAYNAKHNITPMSARRRTQFIDPVSGEVAAIEVPGIGTLRPEELDALIEETYRRMLEAAQKEEYLTAAKYRDELKALQAQKQKLSLTPSEK
jgi:excinuclease ABC subunit B